VFEQADDLNNNENNDIRQDDEEEKTFDQEDWDDPFAEATNKFENTLEKQEMEGIGG